MKSVIIIGVNTISLIGKSEEGCLQDEIADLSSGADAESKDASNVHCKHYSFLTRFCVIMS